MVLFNWIKNDQRILNLRVVKGIIQKPWIEFKNPIT